MFSKQISVFIENRPGRIEDLTRVLSNNNIDLMAISIADTADFGLLRAIVNNTDLALERLRENGYTAKVTDVLAVAVPDAPGGLTGALKTLRELDISVEYLYSLVRCIDGDAVIIFRVDKPEEAAKALKKSGFKVLSQEALAKQG